MLSANPLTSAQEDRSGENSKLGSDWVMCGKSLRKTPERSTNTVPLARWAAIGRLAKMLSEYANSTALAEGLPS